MEKTCEYCVVKRKGHEEEFDERKVYATCYGACLSAHIENIEAEKISDSVCKEIKRWVLSKKAVTSDEIFKKTTLLLKKHDENAAFMYETHRDLS